MDPVKAVVFVRSDDFDPHASRCIDYCQRKGYQVVGIVRDNWPSVLRLLATHEAEIVVVSMEAHLNPRRIPRIEIVAQQSTVIRERRTRFVRRNVAK